MTEPCRPTIFISCAYADEPENPAEGGVKRLSFLTRYQWPAVKQGAVELRTDLLMAVPTEEGQTEGRGFLCDSPYTA